MTHGELVQAMAMVVDHLLNAEENSAGLDSSIETIVDTLGQFNGKDFMSYLEAYMAEMVTRDIS